MDVIDDASEAETQQAKDSAAISDGQVDVELVRRKRLCKFDSVVHSKRTSKFRLAPTVNHAAKQSTLLRNPNTRVEATQSLSTPPLPRKLGNPRGEETASKSNSFDSQKKMSAEDLDALALRRTVELSSRIEIREAFELSKALELSLETNAIESAQRSYCTALDSEEHLLYKCKDPDDFAADVKDEVDDEDAQIRQAIANSLQDLKPVHVRHQTGPSTSSSSAAANIVSSAAEGLSGSAPVRNVASSSSRSNVVWI